MQLVPTAAVPAQNMQVTLGNQACSLDIFTLATGLYMSVSVGGVSVCETTVCEDQALILRDRGYEGFVGDFMFIDLQGNDDPVYTGLGTRWVLLYIEAADLP